MRLYLYRVQLFTQIVTQGRFGQPTAILDIYASTLKESYESCLSGFWEVFVVHICITGVRAPYIPIINFDEKKNNI